MSIHTLKPQGETLWQVQRLVGWKSGHQDQSMRRTPSAVRLGTLHASRYMRASIGRVFPAASGTQLRVLNLRPWTTCSPISLYSGSQGVAGALEDSQGAFKGPQVKSIFIIMLRHVFHS